METSPELNRLMELLDRSEDLHPDLAPHLCDGSLGLMLHHPLMIQVIYFPQENARINEHYRFKVEQLAEAEAKGDWSTYVFIHERPYRMEALMDATGKGLIDDPKAYWDLVGSVWVDSENIFESFSEWCELWGENSKDRVHAMNEDEREAFAALPDTITVYRGVSREDAIDGLSWTTDKQKALWFARRLNTKESTPMLAKGKVSKQDVLAHFLGRNESEVVVLPDDVRNVKVSLL
jgi:hypothetical protein